MQTPTLKNEPVGLPSLLTAALVATWNVIVLVADLEPELAAGVNITIGAWIAVLAWWMRSKVTPVSSLPPPSSSPPE